MVKSFLPYVKWIICMSVLGLDSLGIASRKCALY